MTYSIRIGFLLAILSVIFGAGLYLHIQPPVNINAKNFAHVQAITPPILNNLPWEGDLENTVLFKHFIRQSFDLKSSITWWPHHSITNRVQNNKSFDELFLVDTQRMDLKKLTFMPPYLSTTVQMQKGLFPHRYLHIIRPVIIERIPAAPVHQTVLQAITHFLTEFNFFGSAVAPKSEAKKIPLFPTPSTLVRPPASPQSPLSLSPIVIQSAALMGDMGHTQLILRLSQKPFYVVRTDPSHQTVTLAIDNINPDISSIPPLDTQGTAIQNVAFNVSPENQLLMTLTLLPQMDIQGLRYKENNLIIDVGLGSTIPYIPSNNTTVSSDVIQPVIKKPVPLSDSELAAENYDEAVDLLNQGNTQGAIGLLQMLVQQHSDYLEGRVLLANLLLQQNEAQQALTLLKAASPQPIFSDSPTYYSLVAEAYRQSGDFKSAINVYQQLLQLNSSNGVWWVGLGMCFEGLGQFHAATESYQKALATSTLSPVLQTFVSKKIGATP